MKKVLLTLLAVIMTVTSCGIVFADEAEVFKNLKSAEYQKLMQNTVIVRPGSPDAFVYGKRYSMEDYAEYGETRKDGDKIYVPGGFIKDVFPESAAAEGECELYKFSADNGLNIKEVNGNIYIAESSYEIPDSISGYITKFFGIYVKPGVKGVGTYESPCASLEAAKSTVSEIKKSVGLPDGGINIVLREGTYIINSTVFFAETDSGLDGAPITYRAYKDERVCFDGGISVKGSEFSPVTDTQVKSKLPNPERVVGIDLSNKLSGFGDGFKGEDPANWSVIYKDAKLECARWPNSGFALTGEVLKRSKGRGDTFEFVVGDTRVKNWAKEDDPRMFGYFAFTWAGERRLIAKVNTELLSITSNDHAEYGISADKQYYVYNMLCEMDNPGECYFDKKNSMLYVYPVEGDPKSSEFLNNDVQFSLLSGDMFSLAGTQNVIFKGITFENSLGLAMKISDTCKNIQIRGCTFRNIKSAIEMEGFKHLVSGCDFYNISGRVFWTNCGDRYTLTPSETVITNNRFWNFNTVTRTNSSALHINGVAHTVSHNEFVGGPHIALNPNGNDNIIEYNEFYDNLQDHAADAGPVYNGRNASVLGNIIRNNYFHDIPASMGVIYLDDGESDHTIEGNVFKNTGKIVFIHGGVANKVIDNLSINDSTTGIGFSAIEGSRWDYSKATSVSNNTFLWNLTPFNWQKAPWTKYNHVFQYINQTDKASMYDTVIKGNTFVNIGGEILAISDKDYPNITDEDNIKVNGEDAENYVIPERYKEVMENAGIYLDEDRKTSPELGSFDLLSPLNKEQNIEASEVTFKWSAAENAYAYQFTLATDKEFKNVISNKIVKSAMVTLERLNYFNTRYYWKVRAIANDTNSVVGEKEKKSNQEYFTFTTKAFEVVSREKLTDMIDSCNGKLTAIVEGENPGENKPGTVDAMKSLIAEYQKKSESETITQKEVKRMATELEEKFNKLLYKKNPQVFDMAGMVSAGAGWDFAPNQVVFAKDKLTITNLGASTIGTNTRVEPQTIYKFRVKTDILNRGSWYGFALRAQNSPTAVAWGGNPQYLAIVKKDTIESQVWGGPKNIVNEYPNTFLKDGEEAEVEISTLDQEDGTVLFRMAVNGETVFEYTDENAVNENPGYFEIYVMGKDSSMEVMPSAEPTE